MPYTYDEVYASTLKYFNGDELATPVWIQKYCLKNESGELLELNPDKMHHRLAGELHRIEEKYPNPRSYEEIYEAIKDFKYIIPQGSPMSGIGNNHQTVSIGNCFVIGQDSDSYGSIMQIDQEQIQLMKRRAGVGHDLSHIRPHGRKVLNSALTSTGVVPFMDRYSNSTREVAQDGRRGALMLSIQVEHPDAEAFIDAKMQEGKVTGANVSVKLSDSFMESLETGKPFIQKWPMENPVMTQEVDSRRIWNKIIHNAWSSAEPGVLFWDNLLNESIPACYADEGFTPVSTNPCGELPLCQ